MEIRGISLIGKADVFGALRWVFESLVPLLLVSLDYTFLANYHVGII